jgi:hypothetical protein
MIKYFLFIAMLCVWSLSYYSHFLSRPLNHTMIAYVGSKHMIEFERAFQDKEADLWVFRNRRVRRNRLRVGRYPFETFRNSAYSKMLLLNDIVDVPIINPVTSVVRYVVDNKTVATLWPRLMKWPSITDKNVLKWYSGHVVTIIV